MSTSVLPTLTANSQDYAMLLARLLDGGVNERASSNCARLALEKADPIRDFYTWPDNPLADQPLPTA